LEREEWGRRPGSDGRDVRWQVVGDAGRIAVGDTQAVREQPEQRIRRPALAESSRRIAVPPAGDARTVSAGPKKRGRGEKALPPLQRQRNRPSDFPADDQRAGVARGKTAESLYPEP